MDNYYEYRCNNCKRLLAKGDLKNGTAEIKCGKCGAINLLENKIKVEEELKKALRNGGK